MRKINWIGNFMTSQPDQQSILKHILSNILRSKGNQKIKLGQLIEYNIGNIFLEKSCTKCDVVTSRFKKSKKKKKKRSGNSLPASFSG